MKLSLVVGCLLGGLTGLAQGGVIAYDGTAFANGIAYPPGPLAGMGPALGFAAPWNADAGVQVNLGTLSSFLALPSTGNSVGGFFDSVGPLSTSLAPAPGTEFWASFLVEHTAPNDQTYMGLSPAGAVLGTPPSTASGVRLGQYGIFIGATFFPSLVPFTPAGSTDFLVTRYQASGGTWLASLFVNPTSFAVPDLVLNVPGVTFGSMVNQNQAGFLSDEFRLGDTGADVSPIPAPGAAAVFAGLLIMRRRR